MPLGEIQILLPVVFGHVVFAGANVISDSVAHRMIHERHLLRLFAVDEMEAILARHGFEVLAVTDLYDGPGVGYRAGQPSYDVLARRV